MTKAQRRAWRAQQAACAHSRVEIEKIDGRKYGICKDCFWLMPGRVAKDLQAA